MAPTIVPFSVVISSSYEPVLAVSDAEGDGTVLNAGAGVDCGATDGKEAKMRAKTSERMRRLD